MSSSPDMGAWPVGFEGVERAQHLWSSKWPLADKIAWLEEAQELVEFMQAQYHARRRAQGQTPADTPAVTDAKDAGDSTRTTR